MIDTVFCIIMLHFWHFCSILCSFRYPYYFFYLTGSCFSNVKASRLYVCNFIRTVFILHEIDYYGNRVPAFHAGSRYYGNDTLLWHMFCSYVLTRIKRSSLWFLWFVSVEVLFHCTYAKERYKVVQLIYANKSVKCHNRDDLRCIPGNWVNEMHVVNLPEARKAYRYSQRSS